MDEQTARREIVRVGKLMYERSYVVSSDGNVSVRLDDGRIVATPTQTCKGRMTEESLAVTDTEGKALDESAADQTADILLDKPHIFSDNGYKLQIARALIRRTLMQLKA